MKITFEKLDAHVDMLYLFRRIERNLRRGVERERVLAWARGQAEQAVPYGIMWHISDGHTARAGDIRAAVVDRCTRWADYIIANPPPPPLRGEDYQTNAKTDQLRMKM